MNKLNKTDFMNCTNAFSLLILRYYSSKLNYNVLSVRQSILVK